MKLSLAAVRAEWKRANPAMRYFLATHLAANLLTALISTASVALGAFGQQRAQMLLLVVAALCAGQALLAWSVLQRRFNVRYSLW